MATITLQGQTINTIGNLPAIGSEAPDFTVTKLDLSEIKLSNYRGQKLILNIFPSLDTPTCAAAMKHFNDIAMNNPNALILCISADLPFAQKRFCGIEHLNNVQPVSTFRHQEFGKLYGATMIDGPLKGLLSRCAIVIDEKGKIIYTEQVADIVNEPDYESLTKVIKHENVPN